MGYSPDCLQDLISIHAPLAGCDKNGSFGRHLQDISIHAPLAGCDGVHGAAVRSCMHFNPRTPCGVRPHIGQAFGRKGLFQSTHPLRGATVTAASAIAAMQISIHAPLAGCDIAAKYPQLDLQQISIHAPLAGCDWRGADPRGRRHAISIHAPLAGCDRCPADKTYLRRPISIHAPLAGCDMTRGVMRQIPANFNPRTPCGVRRTGGSRCRGGVQHFNPRTPCGVRPPRGARWICRQAFQSTHPLRGATPAGTPRGALSDYFNPRTPCGVRRPRHVGRAAEKVFQSTHPLRGATRRRLRTTTQPRFQSTHPLRGATKRGECAYPGQQISIHAPLAGCDMPVM